MADDIVEEDLRCCGEFWGEEWEMGFVLFCLILGDGKGVCM